MGNSTDGASAARLHRRFIAQGVRTSGLWIMRDPSARWNKPEARWSVRNVRGLQIAARCPKLVPRGSQRVESRHHSFKDDACAGQVAVSFSH